MSIFFPPLRLWMDIVPRLSALSRPSVSLCCSIYFSVYILCLFAILLCLRSFQIPASAFSIFLIADVEPCCLAHEDYFMEPKSFWSALLDSSGIRFRFGFDFFPEAFFLFFSVGASGRICLNISILSLSWSVFRYVWSWTSRTERWLPDGKRKCRRGNLLWRPRKAAVCSAVFWTSMPDGTANDRINSSADDPAAFHCGSCTYQRGPDDYCFGWLPTAATWDSYWPGSKQPRSGWMESRIQRYSTYRSHMANWYLGAGKQQNEFQMHCQIVIVCKY